MKPLLNFLILAFVVIFVSGCTTQSLAPPKVTINGIKVGHCYGFKPIRPTSKDVDVMSNSLASQILSHDKHGQATCNWKPNGA